MTHLVASIFVETVAELEGQTRKAWSQGADAIELRIDRFEGDTGAVATFLNAHRDRTWIVTCRSDAEGGHFSGDTADRVARLIATTRETGAWVDFEFEDFLRSDNIRQKVVLAATGQNNVERLILSAHDFHGQGNDPGAQFRRMRASRDGAIIKIAQRATHIVDSFAVLDLMREQGRDVVAIAMDEAGLWTRVLAKKFGSFATYASIGSGNQTASGQLRVRELGSLYRWASIDSDTAVFGVVGDPVSHSFSPALFNHWFGQHGINAVYLPLRVNAGREGFVRFVSECLNRPWLCVEGLSVTIPHKQSALSWAGDNVDAASKSIGSANTLTFGDNVVRAYNTDCAAAMDSLEKAMKLISLDLEGASVDVLGAGGASRAILYGLAKRNCRVTLYGRDPGKVAGLAEEFSCVGASWDERSKRRGMVLINTTPVGMWPEVNRSPMPTGSLGGCRLVFDLIYRPIETQLLREAASVGCATLSGLDMFLRQASGQFAIWFDRTPDIESARRLLRSLLAKEANS